MKKFLQGARELSPYLLVELLLPGGTVIALLLWIYRNRKAGLSSRTPSKTRGDKGPGASWERVFVFLGRQD